MTLGAPVPSVFLCARSWAQFGQDKSRQNDRFLSMSRVARSRQGQIPSMSRVEGLCDGGYLRCLGSKIFENPSTGRVLTRSGAFWGSMPGPGLSGGLGVPIVGSKPHASCLPCRIPKSGGPALSSQSTSRSSMRSGTIHRRFGSSRHSALLDRSRAGTPSSSQRSETRSVQPKQSP